jgi:tRNA-modifying protein YgfZ
MNTPNETPRPPVILHGFIALEPGVDTALIRASGTDAAAFLHGQLSNDFVNLAANRAQLAAFCTPKGRMLASFTAWKTSDDIVLECDASVHAATLKRLSMFVMRSKAKLSDATNEIAIFELICSALPLFITEKLVEKMTAPLPAVWELAALEAAQLIRLPHTGAEQRYWLVAPAADRESWDAQFAAALPRLGRVQWEWLRLQSAVARITLPTVEQFVPQMVNFEAVGGVNFKKGCYPGQEIVARSQYLGKLKRRMMPVHSSAPLAAGQEVFHSDDAEQPAGMVVQSAPNPQPGGGFDALVELKLSALDSGSLSAGGTRLEVGTLPYVFPEI